MHWSQVTSARSTLPFFHPGCMQIAAAKRRYLVDTANVIGPSCVYVREQSVHNHSCALTRPNGTGADAVGLPPWFPFLFHPWGPFPGIWEIAVRSRSFFRKKGNGKRSEDEADVASEMVRDGVVYGWVDPMRRTHQSPQEENGWMLLLVQPIAGTNYSSIFTFASALKP